MATMAVNPPGLGALDDDLERLHQEILKLQNDMAGLGKLPPNRESSRGSSVVDKEPCHETPSPSQAGSGSLRSASKSPSKTSLSGSAGSGEEPQNCQILTKVNMADFEPENIKVAIKGDHLIVEGIQKSQDCKSYTSHHVIKKVVLPNVTGVVMSTKAFASDSARQGIHPLTVESKLDQNKVLWVTCPN